MALKRPNGLPLKGLPSPKPRLEVCVFCIFWPLTRLTRHVNLKYRSASTSVECPTPLGGARILDKPAIKSWGQIPLAALKDFWTKADMGFAPKPWHTPPQINTDVVESLLVLTSAYRIYHIPSYQEFYRIMIRDARLKFVHTNGVEEAIMEVYVPRPELPATSNLFNRFFGVPIKAYDPESNVIPFHKPPKR